MKFICGEAYNAKLLEWAALHGKTYDFRDPVNAATAIGVVQQNKVTAVAIYHHFRPNVPDIEMTMIADSARWCTQGAIRALLNYPFNTLGCVRVTCLVARKNRRSRRLIEGLGWKLEGTARRAWDGRMDCMIYGLLRDECRWLKPRAAIAPVAALKATESESYGQEERRVA